MNKICSLILAKLIPGLLGLTGCLSSSHLMAQVPAPTSGSLPLVVMSPPYLDHGRTTRELFEHPEQWANTRAKVNELLFADHTFNEENFSDTELKSWLAQLQQWGLKLELETGAIKEWGVTGQGTYEHEHHYWDRILRLGGKIDSVAMDEPLCCTRFWMHPAKPDEYAVQETANFIALVRKNYPETAVVEIETYPSISVKDNCWWIDALQKRLADMKVRGLDGYRLDVNWILYSLNDNTNSWTDVARIQQFCHSRTLPFSLIYLSPGYEVFEHLGLADDSTWYTFLMQQGYDYAMVTRAPQSRIARELAKDRFGRGGSPDQYVIESWVGAPRRTIPETADFTFTRSVLDFTNKFVK
jgi:hypothetical protein